MNSLNLMVEKKYEFSFENEFKQILDIFHKELKFNYWIEVDVLITDNKTIKKISKEYRNIDKETDVLSFPFSMDFLVDTKYNKVHLGEIVLSFEKIEEQAKEFNHSLKREFTYLFTHALVHLSGRDHKKNQEEEKEFNDIVYNVMDIINIKRN